MKLFFWGLRRGGGGCFILCIKKCTCAICNFKVRSASVEQNLTPRQEICKSLNTAIISSSFFFCFLLFSYLPFLGIQCLNLGCMVLYFKSSHEVCTHMVLTLIFLHYSCVLFFFFLLWGEWVFYDLTSRMTFTVNLLNLTSTAALWKAVTAIQCKKKRNIFSTPFLREAIAASWSFDPCRQPTCARWSEIVQLNALVSQFIDFIKAGRLTKELSAVAPCHLCDALATHFVFRLVACW